MALCLQHSAMMIRLRSVFAGEKEVPCDIHVQSDHRWIPNSRVACVDRFTRVQWMIGCLKWTPDIGPLVKV